MLARHAALLAVLSVACDGPGPTAPRPSRPPEVVQPPPGGGQPTSQSGLVGSWRGSSTVESTGGMLPDCIAPAWRPTFTDAISAEIRSHDHDLAKGFLDLHLRQAASEECHLRVSSQSPLVASPWPFDEFDCAIIPGLCPGPICHFQVKSSEWGCPGTPPEVWILEIMLTETSADASRSRIGGRMEVAYAHRPGDSPTNGPYVTATVTKRFDIVIESR